MKKTFLALICAVTAIFATSCESDNTGLQISVNNASPAVGEEVQFTVTLDGEDVTVESQIFNVTNGNIMLSENKFSSMMPGSFSFKAMYAGRTSEKEAIVTVTGESASFTRRNVLFKATGTWCPYCPDMTTILESIIEGKEDELYEVSLHSGDNLATTASNYYILKFSPSGFPTCIVDANKDYSVANSGVAKSQINAYINKSIQDNPTVSGLKISTDINSDDLITVDVEATVLEENNYKLVVGILVDGYNYSQSGASADYHQNGVLRAVMQETSGGDLLENLAAGSVVNKTYTYDYSKEYSDLPEGTSVKIIAFILNQMEGINYQINNAVCCPLGESMDY